MTVPHLMNCPHSDDGWCLDCVAALGNENWRMRELLNKRPALNAGTLEAYVAWTGEVYASDMGLKPDEAGH